MIQQSPGCDDPDQSVFQGGWSLGTVDGPRGPWSIRRKPERKRGGGERKGGRGEAIESVESDTACGNRKQKQRLEKCNVMYVKISKLVLPFLHDCTCPAYEVVP